MKGGDLMISKEQADLLQKIKLNQLPMDSNFYNSNEIIQDLVSNRYALLNLSYKHGEYMIKGYELTAKGQNELSKFNENKKANFKNNFKYPLLVNIVCVIVGYILGYLTPYLSHLMK